MHILTPRQIAMIKEVTDLNPQCTAKQTFVLTVKSPTVKDRPAIAEQVKRAINRHN